MIGLIASHDFVYVEFFGVLGPAPSSFNYPHRKVRITFDDIMSYEYPILLLGEL